MRIAILCTTYNGEKFLSEQIDSIISQTYKDWILYIRDDGSFDKTKEIIQSYTSKYDNIVLVEDKTLRRGAAMGFMSLLHEVDSKYYMFCDQDDLWLDNKLELMSQKMSEVENEFPHKPILLHTDLTVVDEHKDVIADSFWDYSGLRDFILEKYLPVNNYVTGCTIMMNKEAKKVSFPLSSRLIMHDHWIPLKVSYAGGKIISLPEKLNLYRQHSSNTLGAREFKRSISKKITEIARVCSVNKSLYYQFKDACGGDILSFMKLKIAIQKVYTKNNLIK